MAQEKSGGRPRAPTITIDTSADTTAAAPRHSLGSPTDLTASPTTLFPDMPQPSGASQASSRPDFQPAQSFESQRESRPQSPHNVSSPVASRNRGPPQAYLAVPSHRSRQNSVDSSSEYSETAVGSGSTWQGTEKGDKGAELNHDKIKNDPDALKPDAGKDNDFQVENNPFAFSPGQLSKMFNPKSLPAFYALGGLQGIEKGLRSNRASGLSVEEKRLDGSVTFDQVTGKSSTKLSTEGVESPQTPVARRGTAGTQNGDGAFADRKRVYKDNRIPEKKGRSFLQLVWITYNDKVLILLTAAAIVSLAIGIYESVSGNGEGVEWVEGVAIIVAIIVVVLVGSLNDWQKERQFAKLNKKKQDRLVKAIRSGKTVEISVYDILSGDVLHLEPGDLLPVDGILIQGYDVKCDESQATGESDVIRKMPGDEVLEAIENGDQLKKADPFIQSGARVMEGMGTYMATSTGIYSSYGKTLMALDEDPEITPLQQKLNVIAEYIAKLGGGAGLLLFIVLLIIFLVKLPSNHETPIQKGMQFLDIFIVVVTIIVVAVPEGLPLAVTLALAFATTRMVKDNNLVRHLKACEVMGNATTICSDKTGTLTQNKMQIVSGTLGTAHRFGSSNSHGSEDTSESTSPSDGLSAQEFAKVLSPDVKQLLLKSISLNSTAFEGEVDGVKTFIGSKTETAMLIFAQEHLGMGPVNEERSNEKILQLVPFDSGRKCMGIFVQLPNGRVRLYVKGASEIVLNQCTEIIRDPAKDLTTSTLTDENEQTIKNLIDSYASRSLRTIAIVYREFEQWPPKNIKRSENNPNEVSFDDAFKKMVFIGMVGIQDPLRDGVAEAVKDCQKAGVMVRMVTGDNKLTAQAIAKECGILIGNGIVMEGPEFRNLSKYEQNEIIPRLQVLARSSPEDKRILVRRLKDMGETVAVTGDGTNDAPALKLADVGFSMGIAGTEVAKEASSIILMDDNFNSIVKALKWGRAVNDAVKRFLQFQLTVNITAVILTFVTAISNNSESSVLTAVQLLWVNLIMDTLAALALATDPPQDSVLDRKPERRGSSIISITMWKMILGQAIYQLVITFMLYYGSVQIFALDTATEQEQRETLVFNTFVWMQIFNQWNNRRLDNRFNIFEGLFRNWFFIGINIAMCGAQILIVFKGGKAFSISPHGQTAEQWGYAIALGFISIPIGMVIRCIPDEFLSRLIPTYLKRRSSRVPGLTVSDEERFEHYPEAFTEVKDHLTFIKRYKGGRLNNLKYGLKHPKEVIMQMRSPSHSRSNSLREPLPPRTPVREDSTGDSLAPTPELRARSRSTRSGRSRSNSALGATTVMAGIIAGSVGAGWSPVQERSNAEFPPRGPASTPSPLAHNEELEPVEEKRQVDVPTLKVPEPPHKS
ncbi:hypothetical protein BKA67DRAFT_662354 [Truncatella angustata]|uniref:Calcium-transporting ATPase n=1 Tax=Truncatella angustata TaxID=152316 RepID=A0A9P8RK75_9PEZI|nr:uncharacterized protein BKA67DRAFT_662354 [Truncatella angustata]KAH6647576.1 hypothetical protein BKA67DRAFT_662354 [Truncatella angustata]